MPSEYCTESARKRAVCTTTDKHAYASPRLTLYGRISELTAAGSGNTVESSAQGVCTGNSPFSAKC